ncbi:AlpA family transcriptional regulator [Dickeya poaceiphila]|uniref:AlpA family transcriptional regulator n=2 Tax=Dickeya poaceiphila TaxID=568768 RepID=A0A5B8IJ45_9GAMM|nr:AlpA family transcriptional regulator [Dickeya poaceiphila]
MMSNLTLLRLPDVMKKTSLKKSWIYYLIDRDEFPQPVKLGARSVAWVESEINDWIAERIRQRAEGRK